ncbi:MAG: hypothetical protein H0U18_17735 [Pyrinomonadaceae bacterium]|nr:hypothetical protein [Pyrinomonadaceae bacterium]
MASVLPTVADCCVECGPCDVSVTITTASTSTGRCLFYVNTLAEMRAIPSSTVSAQCQCTVGGSLFAGDGGGGIYFWSPTGVQADDGINFIRPTDFVTAGLWQKLL